jgi:glycosyltransferase involved in cell wall biosynthesis
MKILMLTPYLPYPPASGGQIRTYNLLRYLSGSHDVTLVCLYKNPREKDNARHLNAYCREIFLCKRPERPWQLKNIAKAVFGPWPFLVVRNYSSEAAKTVQDLIKTRSFDIIHAETFYIMPHIPKTNIPILLVEQTLEYQVYKHYTLSKPWYIYHPLRLDTYKLKLWEKFYWRKATLVAAMSDADAAAITALEPEIRPIVIPNGAGDEMFLPLPLVQEHHSETPFRVLFVGNFSWLQNTEAAEFLIRHVHPLIRCDGISLTIAGQNIPATLIRNRSELIHFVQVPDDGSHDIQSLYRTHHAFAAPIFGPGGTRLKILAAMAAHVPVVTTPVGAEGLHAKDGESIMLASSAADFAASLRRLRSDKTLRERLANNAFDIAQRRFSWHSITQQLVAVYEKLVHPSV